jgi:hypothetical protein
MAARHQGGELMGCWLKSKSGAVYRMRDGSGLKAPVREVGSVPVWFETFDPDRFEADKDLKVCALPPSKDAPPGVVEAKDKDVSPPKRAEPAKEEPPPVTSTKAKPASFAKEA